MFAPHPTHQMILLLLLLLFCRYRIFFSLLLLTSKTSNTSEKYTYQEERGGDSLDWFSWVSSFLLRGLWADSFTLIDDVGFFWYFIGSPCGLLEDSEIKAHLACGGKKSTFLLLFVCLFVFVSHLIFLFVCFCKCDTFKSKVRQRCLKSVTSSQIFLRNSPLRFSRSS